VSVDNVDDDTLQAVQNLWLATPALVAVAARAPQVGDLKSTRDNPQTLPYVQAKCEAVPGKTTRYPKAIRKEVRKVTLTVWATYEQVKAALPAVLGTFNARLSAPGRPTLTYPSGARFIKWWPLSDGTMMREEGDAAIRQGQEIWKAVVEAEVTSTRSET
jgi:hypothetical protein